MNKIIDILKMDYHVLWEEKVTIDIYKISEEWYLKHTTDFAIKDAAVNTKRYCAENLDIYEFVMDTIEFLVNKDVGQLDKGKIDRLTCKVDHEDIANIELNIVRSDRNLVKAYFMIDTRVPEVYDNKNMMTLIEALKKASTHGLILVYKERVIEISPSIR